MAVKEGKKQIGAKKRRWGKFKKKDYQLGEEGSKGRDFA